MAREVINQRLFLLLGLASHLPADLGRILVGMGFRYGTESILTLQPSVFRIGVSVLAAALSLDCMVSLVSDPSGLCAKRAISCTMGSGTVHTDLVHPSNPNLRHIFACLNVAVNSQRENVDGSSSLIAVCAS